MAYTLVPEHQGLVQFLQTDDRPSAILQARSDGTFHSKPFSSCLYRNAAFDALAIQGAEMQQLLDRAEAVLCKTSETVDLDCHGSSAALVGHLHWTLRPVDSSRLVAVLKTAASPQQRPVQPVSEQVSPAGLKPLQLWNPAPGKDWIRSDVQGLSPWIEYIKKFDWSTTGLGAMETWADELRNAVLFVMSNPNPRALIWGESQVFIYNEACSPLWGTKHPGCLGQPCRKVWEEIWEHIHAIIESSYEGVVSETKNMSLPMSRRGFVEETYWDSTIMPVMDSEGRIVGLLDEIWETTTNVMSQRRRSSIISISEAVSAATTLQDLWSAFVKGAELSTEDFPYALIYGKAGNGVGRDLKGSLSHPREIQLILESTFGIDENDQRLDKNFELSDGMRNEIALAKPCLEAWHTRKPVLLNFEEGTLPLALASAIPGRAFGDPVQQALISPIISAAGEPHGLVVFGLSPRCLFDEEYRLYLEIVTDVLAKFATSIVLPAESRRAQKMAYDLNIELSHQLQLITRAAERSEAKFSRMAATAPTGMFVFDAEQRPLYVNDAFLHMTGETREEFSARPHTTAALRERIHPDDRERFTAAWLRVREQKIPATIEYRLNKPWTSADLVTGQELHGETWIMANVFPDIGADGKVQSIQGWLTDYSHRRFMENLLSRKLEDALENKRQTENFIDMTSHEMRNPLSAILQSADSISLVLKDAVDKCSETSVASQDVVETIADAAQTIILCAQHQQRIVDDILTLSKLDASLLVICPTIAHPPTLIRSALRMYQAELTRAEIAASLVLDQSYEDVTSGSVILDSSRLLQVVINLLTNAIKFTQFSETREIKIILSASNDMPTGKRHGVTFIPPRHSRPNHTTAPEWGDGPDIYLQIAVTDSGRGLTQDEIHTLFKRFSQASPKTHGQYGGYGLGLFISRELCELQGGRIGVSSSSGRTTFTFFVKAKNTTRGRHVDHLSNGGNGPWNGRLAVKPVSNRSDNSVGHSVETERLEFHDENGHKSQHVPVRMDVDHEHSADGIENTSTDLRELHILIVEDNIINQKVMGQQLRRAGYRVHLANHGGECLDFLKTSDFWSEKRVTDAPCTPLSLILLDLEMPIMDGLTCVREIRRFQREGLIAGHVPVIAVTANARSEQIAVAIDAGMDSVVTKPFRIPDLVPQMHALLTQVALEKGTAS